MALASSPTTVIVDGNILDIETGEILGFIDPEGTAVYYTSEQITWTPTDEAGVTWYFKKRESKVATLRGLQEVKAKRMKELDAKIAAAQSAIESFDRFFLPHVVEVAKNVVGEGKKWATAYGTLKYSSTKRKLSVADEDQAILWAKFNCPGAVKVSERFLISEVPSELKAKALEDGEQIPGLEVQEATSTPVVEQ